MSGNIVCLGHSQVLFNSISIHSTDIFRNPCQFALGGQSLCNRVNSLDGRGIAFRSVLNISIRVVLGEIKIIDENNKQSRLLVV